MSDIKTTPQPSDADNKRDRVPISPYTFDILPGLAKIKKFSPDDAAQIPERIDLMDRINRTILDGIPEAVGPNQEIPVTERDIQKIITNTCAAYIIGTTYEQAHSRIVELRNEFESITADKNPDFQVTINTDFRPVVLMPRHKFDAIEDPEIGRYILLEQDGAWQEIAISTDLKAQTKRQYASRNKIDSQAVTGIVATTIFTNKLKETVDAEGPLGKVTEWEFEMLKSCSDLIDNILTSQGRGIGASTFTASGFGTAVIFFESISRFTEGKAPEIDTEKTLTKLMNIPVQLAKSHLVHFLMLAENIKKEIEAGKAITFDPSSSKLEKLTNTQASLYIINPNDIPDKTIKYSTRLDDVPDNQLHYVEGPLPVLLTTGGDSITTGCPAIPGGVIKKSFGDFLRLHDTIKGLAAKKAN